MKYLDYEKQTAKEFNDILKEGMATGIILSREEDIKFMIELAYNLNYYLTYFISAAQVYGEKEGNNF